MYCAIQSLKLYYLKCTNCSQNTPWHSDTFPWNSPNLSSVQDNFLSARRQSVGRDSSVGIATRYGLDGLGIESRWGRDFPNPSRLALGLTQPPIRMGTRSFPEVKRSGRGVDHPPSTSAEVKERVGLYLYSPSGPSWPVLG
jgi:hypothetical protein